jgi:hypothetical protein
MKGKLVKPQLSKLAKMHAQLAAILGTTTDQTTVEILTETRNRLGELLRWQAPDLLKP